MISPQALQQYLVQNPQDVLDQWLAERGGSLGSDPDPECIADLQATAAELGRVLSPEDAKSLRPL